MANDELADAKAAFERCADAESDNRADALDDLKFARLGEQWPEDVAKQRRLDGRPVLTINRLPSFIRQIVNDSRQNKPQIKVKPVDAGADKATAEILSGLVRNIENQSKADIAYDTAVDFAASCGVGYFRISIEYEYDDSFEKGLRIKRVANPFNVYGDPTSDSADSSDWNMAFITDYMTKEDFRSKYKGAEEVDWQDSGYNDLDGAWSEGDNILVAEYWHREKVPREILLMSNGQIVGADEYKAGQDLFNLMQVQPVQSRPSMSYKITQRIMTGAELLEKNDWAGRYIPIVPVYGEEVNVEGKRYFRSLIRDAKDAQRMFNYWRTTATELVALAPRVPWIGEEGAFDADPNWLTANKDSHAYLMYAKGKQPPMRQPLDSGPAAGALTEASQAADDLKSIMGMFDASLGAKSNETSGVAIKARQREGDISTFHFTDNLARSIRHGGCILLDLIPKVYSGERIVRVLGVDGTEDKARLNDQAPPQQEPDPQAPQQQGAQSGPMENPMKKAEEASRIYNVGAGKYDVVVDTGPSFTTRREEVAVQMTEFIKAYPDAAPIIGDLLVKNLDWPQSEEIADRIRSMLPPQMAGGLPPQLEQMIQEGQAMLQKLQQENEALKADRSIDMQKLQVEQYKAQTDRMQAEASMATATAPNPNMRIHKHVVRDKNGAIIYIVEQPEAIGQNPQQRPPQ
jgi:hypothetical protein